MNLRILLHYHVGMRLVDIWMTLILLSRPQSSNSVALASRTTMSQRSWDTYESTRPKRGKTGFEIIVLHHFLFKVVQGHLPFYIRTEYK